MPGRNGVVATRRRVGVGAVLAILAVGLAIPLLRGQADAPDERPRPPAPEIGLAQAPVVYDVDFADDRHGFALWGRCTDGRDYRCERRLLVTEDGRDWVARDFPEPELAAPAPLDGRVISLGGQRILLTNLAGGGPARFYSDDGGRSWRAVPATASLTVAEIPPDAVLETQCVDTVHDQTECRHRRLAVTLPDSGERAWLAQPPLLDYPTPEQRPAADGGWFVTGREPGSGRWVVAVSRDSGRSWPVAVLPAEPGLVMDRLSLAGSGPNLYLLGTGSRPDVVEPRSLVSIFRSTDGGRSWALTWRASGAPPHTLGGTAIVTMDGALLVAPNDIGPTYRSQDGGRDFAEAPDDPHLTQVRRTRAGYLAVVPGRTPSRYLTSADGVRWTDLPLPSDG